jgi:hypothetical protein
MMAEFFNLCQSVRFQGDVPVEDDDSNYAHKAAEFAARMCSEGLRVTETLTPDIYASVVEVSTRLNLDVIPEVFIVDDPRANASMPCFGREQRPRIILTSRLVQLMTAQEMKFVLGHELGHFGFGHQTILPDGPSESEYEQLRIRSLQRCSEIGADRIGMVTTGSLFTCAMVMVKLISGLSELYIKLDINAFLTQLQTPEKDCDRRWELSSTHPSLPLRLRALISFGQSDVYSRFAGTGGGGRPLSDVDTEVQGLLDQLGDGWLSTLETDTIDLAAAWIGISLVLEDGVVTELEQEVLHSLVGEELATKALNFGKSMGLGAVHEKLAAVTRDLANSGQRAQQRLARVFDAFATRLGMETAKTQAWKAIPAWLQGEVSRVKFGGRIV